MSDKKLTFDSSFSTLAFKKLLVSWRLTRLLVLAWSRQAGDVLAISVRTICLCPFVEAGICFHNFLEARLNVEESHALTVKADYINSERITEFKTKRKKLDWTRTKFFCLPSLLPRQRNKDLQAQSASTLAVQTPHTVCTVHSHNLFFFLPPWLQVKIVDLSCCSWRISTRPRGVWENYPTLPQKHNFTLSDFPPFAFTHLFFRGLVPPQTISHWRIWQLGLICAIVAWCDPIVPKMVYKQNPKISFRDSQKESESCKQSIFSHLVHLKWYVKTFKVTSNRCPLNTKLRGRRLEETLLH